MAQKCFKQGEMIIREGSLDETFYKIVKGDVGIYLGYGTPGEKKITTIGGDEYFGEMGVIETRPRSATAIAQSPEVVVEEYGPDDLNRFFTDRPDQILTIMKQIGSRLQALTNEYMDVQEALQAMEGDKQASGGSILNKILKAIGVYQSNQSLAEKLSAEEIVKPESLKKDSGAKVESFRQGTVIFKEGAPSPCMYYIHAGEVGVYKNFGTPEEVKITTIYQDQMFGVDGMLTDGLRTDTAVAQMDDTTVEIIMRDDLDEMFRTNPAKVDAIVRHLSYRLRSLNREYMMACKKIYQLSEERKA